MIDDLVQGFDAELFCTLLNEKFAGTFSPIAKPIPVDKDLPWKSAEQLGIVKALPDANDVNMPLLVVAAELPEGEELRERSSRIKQFKFAKKVLDSAMSSPSPGVDGLPSQGLFVFHDDQGNFRLSLVYGKPEGTKLVWSAVKRLSFYVEAGDGNKTFRDRVALPWSSFDKLKDAFSVEKLTKEFYGRLFKWYQWALSDEMGVTYPNDTETDEDDRQISEHIIRLITRLMFVWFLKQKHLVPDDLFNQAKLKQVLKKFDPVSGDNYYRAILQNLFFATLNSEIPERAFATQTGDRSEHFDIKTLYRYPKEFSISEADVLELFKGIPFLNGGLFECLDRGRNYYDGFSRNRNKAAKIPNRLFFDETEGIIPLLCQYNFTVEENSPGDEEVALDPELLGQVFENLLGAYNPETEVAARKATGSFYTPREIVNYMVDESLIAHLKARCGEEQEEMIRKLFDDGECPENKALCEQLDQALVTAKILDPACGSGAFPMGILLRMVELLRVLRGIPEDNSVYELKLQLIENCIYGADIQCIAVQISKLRFFISLVCEQKKDDSAENYGINSLPNLETKFVAANSLIGLPQSGRDILDLCTGDIATLKEQLFEVRHQHFSAKTFQEKKGLRREDKKLRGSIKHTVRHDAQPDRRHLELLLKEREKVAEPRWEEIAPPPAKQEEMFAGLAQADTIPADLKYDANEKQRKALDAEIARENKRQDVPSTEIDSIADMLASWDPYDQNTSASFLDPEWMFNVTDGFDLVIGNPPYGIRYQRTAPELRFPGADHALKVPDSYMVFILRCTGFMVSGGSMSFIVPNTFCDLENADAFRRHVLRSFSLRNIWQTGWAFDSAVVDTLVFFMSKRPPKARAMVEILIDGRTFARSLQSFLSNELSKIDYRNDASDRKLLDKLSTVGTPLSNLASVKAGVKLYERGKGIPPQDARVIAKKPYTVKETCPKGWRPLFRGGHVERYRLAVTGEFVHYGEWLAAPRAPELFEGPKILVRRTDDVLRAALEEHGGVAVNSCHVIKILDSRSERPAYEYLAACLNSRLLQYFFERKNPQMVGKTFAEIKVVYVERLPVRVIDCANEVESEIRDTLIGLARRVTSARTTNPSADVSPLEAEIDQLVYKLYGLTTDEIALVEESAATAGKASGRSKKTAAMPKKKVRRKRKADLPPSLPGWD